MKNVMITLAMCLFAVTSVSAQNRGPQQGQRGPAMVNLAEIPGITAEQVEKIEAVHKAQREEMQKMFQTDRAAREKMTEEERTAHRAKMDEMRANAEKQIGEILTAEQLEFYKTKQEELQKQGRHRGPNQGQRGNRRTE